MLLIIYKVYFWFTR